MINLENAVAVLVGAGRENGIGSSIALKLAQKKCNIVINCMKSFQQAESLIRECKAQGVDADLFMGDVSNEKTCKDFALFVKNKFEKVDILINCLGITKKSSYENLSDTAEGFARILEVNTIAPYLVIKSFHNLILDSPIASIINISSAAGITGIGSSIAYATSKGALNTLTQALAFALAPKIRVNAICPSFVNSSWWDETVANNKDKYDEFLIKMANSNILGKIIEPEDIAKMAICLIENPVITGELIRINAGIHIGSYKNK